MFTKITRSSLDEKVKALQVELIGYKADSDEAHKLGLEIIALREKRDKLLAETALQKQRVKEIEEILPTQFLLTYTSFSDYISIVSPANDNNLRVSISD